MDSSFKFIVSSSPAVLVDFYADWCAPCIMVIPVLEDVVKHFDGKLLLHKIDIDKYTELSKSLSIKSVPTLMLYKNGKEVWRMRGFEMAPELIRIISSHL